MTDLFAKRMDNVHKSFIREILKITENPEVISFAGGLPHPDFFPVKAIADATEHLLKKEGSTVLQYSTTEGYLPLREYIAARYKKRFNITISPDEILITNGSQQALDLLGKIFIDTGDHVLLERPSYLGAIQSFSLYKPQFHQVELMEDGVDIEALEHLLAQHPIKLFYGMPNFQNPSGISYSEEKRQAMAECLKQHNTVFIEDDPYGELRFQGSSLPSMRHYLGDQCVILGSFSKTVAPALRLGWICANPEIMEKLLVVKQASDLHSNYFAQRVVHQYLQEHNLDDHIALIQKTYGEQRNLMLKAIAEHFPEEVSTTHPEGGMFLWVMLPKHLAAMDLLNYATELNVAFVPGEAFYVDKARPNTLRLNFSNASAEQIEIGIKRLAQAIKRLLAEKTPA